VSQPNELDTIAASLAREGYYLGLKRRREDWQCELWNAVTKPHCIPRGTGPTSLEAVKAAVADRDEKLKRK
jgi:hypothetical protein